MKMTLKNNDKINEKLVKEYYQKYGKEDLEEVKLWEATELELDND